MLQFCATDYSKIATFGSSKVQRSFEMLPFWCPFGALLGLFQTPKN